MDLGISRYHYEGSGAGFSFDRDEDLDMRLGRDLTTTAADIVNTSDAAEIADILFRYGEEKFARLIAARASSGSAKRPDHRARAPGQSRGSGGPADATATGGSIPPPARSRPCGSP